MPPSFTEDEIDDLIYFARAGEADDLSSLISSLAEQRSCSAIEILMSARDEGKNTCLHMAAGNGHTEIVKALLGVLSKDSVSSTAEEEDEARKKAKVEFLDATNEYGNTGLHWAAGNGHLEIVKLLMEEGASPALANDKNYIPLDLAGLGDKAEVVDYFLSRNKEQDEDLSAMSNLEIEETTEEVTEGDEKQGEPSMN